MLHRHDTRDGMRDGMRETRTITLIDVKDIAEAHPRRGRGCFLFDSRPAACALHHSMGKACTWNPAGCCRAAGFSLVGSNSSSVDEEADSSSCTAGKPLRPISMRLEMANITIAAHYSLGRFDSVGDTIRRTGFWEWRSPSEMMAQRSHAPAGHPSSGHTRQQQPRPPRHERWHLHRRGPPVFLVSAARESRRTRALWL